MDDSTRGAPAKPHAPSRPGDDPPPATRRPAPADARAERLAAALRANLRRRKAADPASADATAAGAADPPAPASED